MTGPENYREATVIVEDARCDYGCPHAGCPHEMAYLARAQVHATLATAAAFLAVAVIRPDDRDEWDRAMGIAAEQAAEMTPVTEAEDPYGAGSYVVDMDSGQVVIP